MPPSTVDIWNYALLRVGSRPLADVDDDTESARVCAVMWPFARRHVLRSHSWNAATVRTSLSPLVAAPAWDFEYQFALPADCLHLMEVDTTDDWRIENGYILADEATIDIRYIKDETDVTKYDASLAVVMGLRLAVEICEKLTSSRGKRELLLDEYLRASADAMADDGEEQSPSEFEEDDWITSRY